MKFVFLSKKAIYKSLLMLAIFCTFVGAVAFSSSSGLYLGKVNKKQPINSVNTIKKIVAITVMLDGDKDTNSSTIQVLDKYNVPYTVFISGQDIESNQELVANNLDNKRIEWGSSGNTRSDQTKLKQKAQQQDMQAGVEMLKKATKLPVELYRAPQGKYNDKLIDSARQSKLYPIGADLSIDDISAAKPSDVVRQVMNKLQNGSIINFNASHTHTMQALPIAIVALNSMNWEFVKVGDMLIKGNYSIDSNGRQFSA